MASASETRRFPIPAMIGTAFGGLWSVWGATALPSQWTIPATIVGLLITVFFLIQLYRKSSATPTNLFRRRAYIVAVILEVAGLYVAMSLLQRYGLQSYTVQAVGLVVGLHFIGLWLASNSRHFIWICLSMCAVSLLGALLPNAAAGHLNGRDIVTAYGCALTLWFFARNP